MANKTIVDLGPSLSGVELYYRRIHDLFDAMGKFNEVRGIYDKLDEWMPPSVAAVYHKTYHDNRRIVEEKYAERKGRIERIWGYVLESCNELGIKYTEQDIREFRALARSTDKETKFRTKVGGLVNRKYAAAGKERENRLAGKTPKPIHVMSLREIITWYQTPRKK